MLLEFTADWCIPCKELERLTYPHPLVRAQAKRFVMVRIDATDPDEEIERLFERYRVFGLPRLSPGLPPRGPFFGSRFLSLR